MFHHSIKELQIIFLEISSGKPINLTYKSQPQGMRKWFNNPQKK